MSGYGWYFKVKKSGQVCVTCSGDGSSHSSYVWPGYRTCANYKLPVVFGITNNFQGVSNPTPTVAAAPYLADYPASLGIPCVVVDGNNVGAVYSAMKEAIDRARAGDGPSVVEMLTFRWYDHSGTAGAKIGQDGAFGLPYRTDDEVRAWLSRDPVVRFANFLKDKSLFTQAELDAQKTKVLKVVDDAVAFGRASPVPKGPDGAKGVWVDWVAPATQWFEHVVRTT
jgi:pyruvate dehydrogenase E1 component alpha subunit